MATRLLHVVPACIGAQLLCNNPASPPKNVRQQVGGRRQQQPQINKMFKVRDSSVFQTCWPDIAT